MVLRGHRDRSRSPWMGGRRRRVSSVFARCKNTSVPRKTIPPPTPPLQSGPNGSKSPVVHIVNKVAHHDFGELGALHVREMWRRCIDGVVFVRYSRLAR